MRLIPYNHEAGKLPPSISKIPLFSRIGESSLDEILFHSSLAEFEPGEVIIREGTATKEFFILLKGAVQVTKSGKQVTLLENAGELIGELAVLNKAARSATVVATNKVFCLKVDPGFVDELSDDERSAFFLVLYRFLVEVLSERLVETSKRVAELEGAGGGG